jgi:DNA-binding NarL/FixJ family response regulator
MNSPKNILIVDDHPIVRRGFIQLINQEPDLVITCEAESTNEAIQQVEKNDLDFVIVDISLKNSNGIDLIKHLTEHYGHIPILVVSMHDESLYAERSIRAGAKGYLMKQEADEAVVKAIRHILRGGIYLNDRIKEKILINLSSKKRKNQQTPMSILSDRELEVFQLIGEGFGTRQISEQLNVSVKTIESYRARIKDKLQIESGIELIQKAVLWVQKNNSSN